MSATEQNTETKDLETKEGLISLEDDKYDDGTPVLVIETLLIALEEVSKGYIKLKEELDDEVDPKTLNQLMSDINHLVKSFETIKEFIPIED